MQITFPQLRQLGTAAKTGCRPPTQLQRREAMPSFVFEAWEGSVEISRDRMAWSRSEITLEEPCMGTPPVMEILVVADCWLLREAGGPGVEVREEGLDLDFCLAGRSDMRVPAADGGGLEEGWEGGGLLGPLKELLEGVDARGFEDMYSSS